MQGWYALNPEAVTQQESESTLPLNLESTLAALDAAHERIRQQDAELETLRSAVAQVRRLNTFLLAELEQARQLLHDSAPSASATSFTLAIDTSGIQEPWTLSHPFGPGASATGSSIPRPFQTGGSSSSSYPQRLEDLPDHVPTLGSAGHSEGQCRPCFYVFSRNGCKFGRSCTYCHLNHAKPRKERPPKLVRQECREIANEVFRSTPASADPEGRLRGRRELSNAGPVTTKYAASVLRAISRQQEQTEPFDPGRRADQEG